jgi:hypothetical protein
MNQLQQTRERTVRRVGAISAVLGVVAALVQSAIDPSYSDDAGEAIQQASQSSFLTSSRVLDMTAFLLLLVGVAVITRTFSGGPGAAWARLARTMFAVSAAAGAIATMIVGTFPDIADSWADAAPALKPGYVAAYDALDDVSGGVFAVSWAALAVFGIVFGVALAQSGMFPRRLSWISVGSGVSLAAAVVVGIAFHVAVAFVLLIVGLLLSYLVLVTVGLRVWRLAGVDLVERPLTTSR